MAGPGASDNSRGHRLSAAYCPLYFHGSYLMPVRPWQVLALALCFLSGCNGNYVFDDDDYRPLGDPHAIRRSL